jgi:putative pyruvate formate lyase activating enzyme
MYRQVGDLVMDEMGIAQHGLIIRHLIMPENISDTKKVIDFIRSLSSNVYINLMDQYHPAYKANNYENLNRRITPTEYQEAYDYAIYVGLNRLAV